MVAVALAVLGGGGAARAAGEDEARAHVAAAVAYFQHQDFAGAVRELEAAYAMKAAPDIQYNLGECYQKLDRIDEAIAAYRRYLAARPGAEDRGEVGERIAYLTGRKGALAAGTPPPAPAVVEKIVFKTVVIYRAPPPPPGRGARFAGFGVAVLAVGGLVAGIALAALADGAVRTIDQGGSASSPPVYDGRLEESARSEWIACGVSFAVAAVAAAGSAALFVLARRIDREAPKVTLAPGLAPGGGALVLEGRF